MTRASLNLLLLLSLQLLLPLLLSLNLPLKLFAKPAPPAFRA